MSAPRRDVDATYGERTVPSISSDRSGTFNHFAKDLGLPLDLEQAVDVICQGRTATIDVGEVNGRYFVNSSWLGVYPLVIRIRDPWRMRLPKSVCHDCVRQTSEV